MGLKRVSWVRRYQGQCLALRPLGHQGYRLRSYKKDPPLCSGYSVQPSADGVGSSCVVLPSLGVLCSLGRGRGCWR